jgi:hypothetical protein
MEYRNMMNTAKVWFNNNFIYHHKIGHKGFGFNKLNPLLYLNKLKTFFRNGLILVLLSSLSNKTILYNEKIFNNWFIILIHTIAVVVFLYFMSTPLPEGQRRIKAENLQTKFNSNQSNTLGF